MTINSSAAVAAATAVMILMSEVITKKEIV